MITACIPEPYRSYNQHITTLKTQPTMPDSKLQHPIKPPTSPSFLNGITILLAYQLVGEITSRLLQLPIPGPVIGMILLFVTLLVRGTFEKHLDTASSALLSHLSLLFVPAGVGVVTHLNLIGKQWLPITAALVFSTILTLAVTALIMLSIKRLLEGKRHAE